MLTFSNSQELVQGCSGGVLYDSTDRMTEVDRKPFESRAWKTNLLQVCQAVLFVFVIWAVDKAITYSRERTPAFSEVQNPPATAVTGIPDCSQNKFLQQGVDCLTFLYTPNNDPAVNAIVAAMRANNSPAVPESKTMGFASMSQIDAYLYANPQKALGAVHFNTSNPQHISITLQSNSSINWFKGHYQHPNTYFQLPLQMAAERESARYLANDSKLAWDVSYTSFAHPASQSASVVGNIAPTFLFASAMFNFVLLLHNLVTEKESGVRQVMSTMGLLNSPFWLTWSLFEGLQALLSSLLVLAAAYAFHFDLVWQNSFALSFLLLLLTNLALVAFCFFISTLLQRASAAVPTGFVVFIVAWVMLLVVAFGFPYSVNYSKGFVALFSLFPWTLLGKGIRDLASATTGDGAVGISWSQRYSYCQAQTPPPSQQGSLGYYTTDCVAPLPHLYIFAALQCVFYMLLAVYLDKVLPDRMGVRLPPWYPLLPSYWNPSKKTNTQRASAAMQLAASEPISPSVDTDVTAETAALQLQCRDWVRSQERFQLPLKQLAAAMQGSIQEPQQMQGSSQQTQPGQVSSQRPQGMRGAITDCLASLQKLCSRICQMGLGERPWGSASVPCPSCSSDACSSAAVHDETAQNAQPRAPSQPRLASDSVSAVDLAKESNTADAGHLAALNPNSAAIDKLNKADVSPLTQRDVIELEDSCTSLSLNATSMGDRRSAVQMFGLRRTFVRRPALWRRVIKREKNAVTAAVEGNWLAIHEGECFCLLGPNGAGKSTTINCLTGVLPATAGEVIVNGSSITHQGGLDRVRGAMGVCNQFDVLWDNLTGREHLLLFGAIKGLTKMQAAAQADALLEQVKLTAAGGVRAGAYSGGMRRRLSLAIALLGNPKILYLDEPTTGMDPVSRRHLWDLIASVKKQCAVVLTTHSMEEADILGDRIGIMARGRLRCLGSGLHLKQKFGSGYRLSIQLQQDSDLSKEGHEQRLQDIVMFVEKHSGAVLVDKLESQVHFKVPTGCESKLSAFFRQVKANKLQLGITDVQLRLTPLEEVFSAVVRQAEVQHAQYIKQTVELVLGEGTTLQVVNRIVAAQYNHAPLTCACSVCTTCLFMPGIAMQVLCRVLLGHYLNIL
ncbi:hypothetical protein ABBQ38_013538 [Trebouxia sp. C0009 RCD-2024]